MEPINSIQFLLYDLSTTTNEDRYPWRTPGRRRSSLEEDDPLLALALLSFLINHPAANLAFLRHKPAARAPSTRSGLEAAEGGTTTRRDSREGRRLGVMGAAKGGKREGCPCLGFKGGWGRMGFRPIAPPLLGCLAGQDLLGRRPNSLYPPPKTQNYINTFSRFNSL